MQQKSYEFTVSKVHEGQSFSSFKVLFRTVTGREPPTGKKNLDIVKKNLARYVEYRPLMEVDSTATSKRAVIITAIHEDPLPMEDHRGERGTYADFMRPLVLKLTEFEGKMYVLCNELGLFSRYFQEMQRSSVVKDTLGRNGEFEYNLWNTNEKLLLGEREYNALLYRQLRDVLKRTLDSLQKKGILEWGFIFKCQPDLFYDVGNGKYRKKSLVELKDEKQAYLQEIQKEAGRANALLNVELVVPLINGIDISNPFVRGKYTPYGEDRNEVVYCTLQQEEAIQNAHASTIDALRTPSDFSLSEIENKILNCRTFFYRNGGIQDNHVITRVDLENGNFEFTTFTSKGSSLSDRVLEFSAEGSYSIEVTPDNIAYLVLDGQERCLIQFDEDGNVVGIMATGYKNYEGDVATITLTLTDTW